MGIRLNPDMIRSLEQQRSVNGLQELKNHPAFLPVAIAEASLRLDVVESVNAGSLLQGIINSLRGWRSGDWIYESSAAPTNFRLIPFEGTKLTTFRIIIGSRVGRIEYLGVDIAFPWANRD